MRPLARGTWSHPIEGCRPWGLCVSISPDSCSRPLVCALSCGRWAGRGVAHTEISPKNTSAIVCPTEVKGVTSLRGNEVIQPECSLCTRPCAVTVTPRALPWVLSALRGDIRLLSVVLPGSTSGSEGPARASRGDTSSTVCPCWSSPPSSGLPTWQRRLLGCSGLEPLLICLMDLS